MELSSGRVIFAGQSLGWYKLRGAACIRDEDLDRQEDPTITCGVWTSFRGPVELEAP